MGRIALAALADDVVLRREYLFAAGPTANDLIIATLTLRGL